MRRNTELLGRKESEAWRLHAQFSVPFGHPVESVKEEKGYWICGGHIHRFKHDHIVTGGHDCVSGRIKIMRNDDRAERGRDKHREHSQRSSHKAAIEGHELWCSPIDMPVAD